MLLVDTGPVVAMADRRDRLHEASRDVITEAPGPLVMSAQVSAEVDYLLATRLGAHARAAFRDDLANERFRVECLAPEDYRTAAEIGRRYADLNLSLADLSLAVLADRFGATTIASFDARHFRALRPLNGGSFTLLPADLGG